MKLSMRLLVPCMSGCLLLATSMLAPAAGPIRLDGSSDGAAERSFKAMIDASPRAQQGELIMAMLKLNLTGVSSAAEMLADPELRAPSIKRIRQRVDGLTAGQIIALAAEGSSITTFFQGEEPGIPADLLAPLPEGPVAHPLEGSAWRITSDVNGHISHTNVRLDPAGRAHVLGADADSKMASTWEQSGNGFLLTLNDRFAVYRGQLDGEGLSGIGGNVNGTTWSWSAAPLTD